MVRLGSQKLDFDVSEAWLAQLIDAAPIMAWISDTKNSRTHFNKLWLDFTGRTLEQERGDGWADGIHEDDVRYSLDTYKYHFDRREPFQFKFRLKGNDGSYHWILDAGVPRFSNDGTFFGFTGSCADVTEIMDAEEQRRQSVEKQAAQYYELHHRVKNNAQRFISLLSIQRSRAGDPRTKEALRVAMERATALIMAQDILYSAGHYAAFDLGAYLRRLAEASVLLKDPQVRFTVEAPVNINVPIELAAPIGLMINELLSNALRHAFPGGGGHLRLELRRKAGAGLSIVVLDNGVGLPHHFALEQQQTSGLAIVRLLARQIGAELVFAHANGTCVTINIPQIGSPLREFDGHGEKAAAQSLPRLP